MTIVAPDMPTVAISPASCHDSNTPCEAEEGLDVARTGTQLRSQAGLALLYSRRWDVAWSR